MADGQFQGPVLPVVWFLLFNWTLTGQPFKEKTIWYKIRYIITINVLLLLFSLGYSVHIFWLQKYLICTVYTCSTWYMHASYLCCCRGYLFLNDNMLSAATLEQFEENRHVSSNNLYVKKALEEQTITTELY